MKPRTKSTATASGSPATKSRNRKISPASIDGAIKSPMPDFIEPCLATLVAAPPQGDDWVHEIKFDGYRIQARIDGDGVKLITRSGLDWTEWLRLVQFVQKITQMCRGKAYSPRPTPSGNYLLMDYMNRKTHAFLSTKRIVEEERLGIIEFGW